MLAMKTKVDVNSYWLALLLIVVVCGFAYDRIATHSAWVGGTATVMGFIDRVDNSTKARVIHYSYDVGGRHYRGDETSWTEFDDYGPVTVTYAKSDPSVSSILPATVQSKYVTSVTMSILSFLPLILVAIVDFRRRRAAKSA